jgi:hypothetical protein
MLFCSILQRATAVRFGGRDGTGLAPVFCQKTEHDMNHPTLSVGGRLLSLPLLCLLMSLSGCAVHPAPISRLGRDAANSFEAKYGGLFEDLDTQDYVQSVGLHLVHFALDLPSYDWQFRVLNSEEPNAYALPDGLVYITHGLLTQLDNEAELAAILAHEIGHIATGQVGTTPLFPRRSTRVG